MVKYEDSCNSLSEYHENESQTEDDCNSQTDTDGSGQYELRIVDGRLQAVGFTKYHRNQRQQKSGKPILKRLTRVDDKQETRGAAKSPSFWKEIKDCFF